MIKRGKCRRECLETIGVVVGCDRKQEWLLPWWWSHYSAHNTHPVAFADFGMSDKALAWCKERGECIAPVFPEAAEESAIATSLKQQWEERYGRGIWFCRSAWFKKPLAVLNSPFSIGLWLDLDCQVRGKLDPLFNSLFGADIGLVREPGGPEEKNYNAGVIVFRKKAEILYRWAEEATEHNAHYAGDQEALCQAIMAHSPALIELPFHYNWLRVLGPNPDALIYHFTGGTGKLEIMNSAAHTS